MQPNPRNFPVRPPRGSTRRVLLVVALIAAPILVMAGGLALFLFDPIYSTMFVSSSMATDFIEAGARGDAKEMHAMIARDDKAEYSIEKIEKEYLPLFDGYDGIELNKNRSMGGSYFGDESTLNISGYVKYKDTYKRRGFSFKFIRLDGKWYVTTFSLSTTLSS
jgi:hypothetical protein